MTGEVIILTGPPGAGKTTVAELLASEASSPAVHLTTDQFYRSIRSGFVLPFLPAAHRQNEVVIDAVVATVTTFARGGYDVVVDGIVGPWFLPPFRAAADRDGLTLSYVVLRPDLDTTLSRARQRAEHELKDVEAITGLYAAFERLADLEDHAIDTGQLDAVQTAAEVRRVLASGEYRLS
ncbi:ATP-binding protein [Nocardia gipuzkoensis]|uniref:AAA family ATPase n=1 Tax=Nocardia gipuzkoensis TaxID=2749991 RepID=UPI001E2AAA34|nr:AAA family ATPase [Nocardia gipuzkoensis]UGT68830.1 ATP-binding protein [Nocardia gipuzkoensis]